MAERERLLATVAFLRWRLFVNSLRGTRGQLELLSRVALSLVFGVAAVGGAIGLGTAAWWFVVQGQAEWVTLLLWPVLMFWQFFPVLSAAFASNFDASSLLRFPLSYRGYFTVRVLFGAFDMVGFIGASWSLGIAAGMVAARVALLPWVVATLSLFALANILLSRGLLTWLERWLAQRRTRELMSIAFFLLLFAVQLLTPLLSRESYRRQVGGLALRMNPIQRVLPPGVAAAAIAAAGDRNYGSAALRLLELGGYVAGIGWLLHLRLRREYRGENLSEAESAGPRAGRQERKAWLITPGGTFGALLNREVLYLVRSGPALLTLLVPLVMLAVFRNSGGGLFVGKKAEFALPVLAGYSLLLLTNTVYNSFGPDGGGVQFYFLAPVRISQVFLAKNTVQAGLFTLQLLLGGVAVALMFGVPAPPIVVTTLCASGYGVLTNLAAGNALSLYSPKKVDTSTFGRQRAAPLTVLASLCVQIAVVGVSALIIYLSLHFAGTLWPGAGALLLVSGAALIGYRAVLRWIEQAAIRQRESLIAEVAKV